MADLQQLLQAIREGNVAEVTALIAAGMDVNAVEGDTWTPLHEAIEHQQLTIVQALITAGADVNSGWSPLVHAIDIEGDSAWQRYYEPGHATCELTTLLLDAGAIPTDEAFEVAKAYDHQRALMLLERKAKSGLPNSSSPSKLL